MTGRGWTERLSGNAGLETPRSLPPRNAGCIPLFGEPLKRAPLSRARP
jgi:hypothetical protein